MRTLQSIALALLFCSSALGFDFHTNTAVFVVTNSVSGDFDAFTWEWSGYDDQKVKVGFDRPVDAMALRLAYGNNRRVFVDITDQTNYSLGTTNWSEFSLYRTNMPPDGIYLAELVNYDGATVTNSFTRTYAKGRVIISQSIFAYTNQASWLNPYAGVLLGPPTHTIVNPELWPFVSTVTGVYSAAGETFAVLDTNEAAAVQMSATGGLPQIQFRSTDGAVATLGLVNGNLGFGIGSSNMISITNYLSEQNAEADPLSLHLNGNNAMTGDANIGGQDVTNVSDIIFTSGLQLPLYATNTRAQLTVVSNLVQTLHATQTYALGVASTALTAVDSALLTTATALRASINAVSNAFGSSTGFVTFASLNVVSNNIYVWGQTVDANNNNLTNAGSLRATSLGANAQPALAVHLGNRTLLSTGGVAVAGWGSGETFEMYRNLDLNGSNVIGVEAIDSDSLYAFTITNSAFYGSDVLAPLIHAQGVTNIAINVEDRQLWAQGDSNVLDWASYSNLKVVAKGLQLGGEVRTNWYRLPSYSLYEAVGVLTTNSPLVSGSVVGLWTNATLSFTTPATGQIRVIYSFSAAMYSSPQDASAYMQIFEKRGTGVVGVTAFETNVVTARLFCNRIGALTVGAENYSGTLIRTNLAANTRYEYNVYYGVDPSETTPGAISVQGFDANASAQVYFK